MCGNSRWNFAGPLATKETSTLETECLEHVWVWENTSTQETESLSHVGINEKQVHRKLDFLGMNEYLISKYTGT